MGDALNALFEQPREDRFERALASTADAIAALQQLLASFTPPREERHRLQRILSQLHFIRTALLDPQSPLEPLMGEPGDSDRPAPQKEFPMPRDIAVLDAYVPAIVLLFIAGAALTWVLDRVIAWTGLYRVVWHPSLFRASLLVCVCGVLGLAVYR